MIYWRGILVTFGAYVSVHAGRKAFTNTKAIAMDVLGLDSTVAGALDATFMLAYAVGLVWLGRLGDRVRDPNDILVFSLASMSVLQVLFACLLYTNSSTILLFIVWILNGMVQSLAWPCCVKLVGVSLSGGANSSTVFSVWACNGIVGNICCSLLSAFVLDHVDSGRVGLLVVFGITSICNIVAILWLKTCNYPAMHSDGVHEEDTSESIMSLKTCLGLRGVIDYSMCHAFVKGVAYAMFFWLPFYLVKVHKVTAGIAAATTVWYDLATLVGGPLCGLLVQKTNKPAIVISVFVLLAAAPQFCINEPDEAYFGRYTDHDSIPLLVLFNIVLSGFLVGGVLNVLSAAVCAKIGGLSHTSMVTGVIDGLGSLGASATQVAIPMIGVDMDDDWTDVFGLLGCMLIASAVTLFRVTRDEFKPSPIVEYQIQH